MANPKFFITHSFKNVDFARRLADDLRAHGLEGFFDVASMSPGDNFTDRISHGLEECDIYLPILSHASLQSRWCNEEINAAVALNNEPARGGRPRIISLVIDDCHNEIPVFLRARLFIDFTKSYASALDELLQKGFGITPAQPTGTPESASAVERSVSRPAVGARSVVWLVGAAALGVIVVGAILFAVFPRPGSPTPIVPTVPSVAQTTLTLQPSAIAPTLSPAQPSVVPPTALPTAKATAAPSATPICAPVTGQFATLWQQFRNGLGCASAAPVKGLVAEEPFVGGRMLWREKYDVNQIVGVFNDGTWKIFKHPGYVSGSPEFPCADAKTPAQSPPTPKRGFGGVWCDTSEVRQRLGNATEAERGYDGILQLFDKGFMLRNDQGLNFIFYTSGNWEIR